MSLQSSDAEAEKVAVAPRVTLADIEHNIAERYDFRANRAIEAMNGPTVMHNSALTVLSICILVTKAGFSIIGKSAPASVANFNEDLGKKLAYEDCIRQMWPLMGFALREKLALQEASRRGSNNASVVGGKS